MILIRADANETIGAGHVMRCLSVARALADSGETVRFVTADHKADGMIRRGGFESLCLDSDWRALEAEGLEEVIRAARPDRLLIDSYQVTEAYMRAVSALVPTAYLDDLNRETWKTDLLINYNIFADGWDYSGYKVSGTRVLTGPECAPLRKEFRGLGPHRCRETKDVLVSTGGSDPLGLAEQIEKEICPGNPEIRFHFVIGALNPNLEKLRKAAGGNVILHVNEQWMAALMTECDMAVSAAGSTLYELCAAGTPTVTYTMADNQMPAAEAFAKRGLMLNAGDCRNKAGFIGQLEECIRQLARDREKRESFSAGMQKVVDGKGAERIAAALTGGKRNG